MTHRELLNRLPSPYNEQAIENCTNHRPQEYLEESFHSQLPDLLRDAFPWRETPKQQGWNYWEALWLRARAGEFDDPSVTLPREDWELLSKAPLGAKYKHILKEIQSQLNPKQ